MNIQRKYKKLLNFKINSFFLLFDFINFVRNNRKRLKHYILNQNTFKFTFFIFLLNSNIISLLNQNFKFRSYTFFVFINIFRKQARAVFFKARSNKRIFERDFSRYNKILNRIAR